MDLIEQHFELMEDVAETTGQAETLLEEAITQQQVLEISWGKTGGEPWGRREVYLGEDWRCTWGKVEVYMGGRREVYLGYGGRCTWGRREVYLGEGGRCT